MQTRTERNDKHLELKYWNLFGTCALVFCGLALAMVSVAYAQVGDTFEVNQEISAGGDVTAPSIPIGLSATAVSTTQIELSWTASTDNIGVTGYQVFRDSVQIATTTLTTYSDTGLSDNTTYAYTLTAFDAAGNISALSAITTATTFDGGGISGGRVSLKIFGVETFPDTSSSVILWKTTRRTKATLSWGMTPDYELGNISEVSATTEHKTVIADLSADTRYYFRIVAQDATSSNISDTFTGSFQTLSLPDKVSPLTVTNFVATGYTDRIGMSWTNPKDSDFELIRIVRSPYFFPEGPFDGAIVYEGTDEAIDDTTAEENVLYYYSAFARDEAGNYSGPAVATAKRTVTGTPPTRIDDPFAELPQAFEVHPILQKLSFADFDFFQQGEKIQSKGSVVSVDGGLALGVGIDYEKLPEILKTIGITLIDPYDSSKSFSFLLRVNEEKTRYLATVAPLIRGGGYDVSITIIDFNNQAQKRINALLDVAGAQELSTIENTSGTIFFWIFLLLLLLLFLFKKKDKQKVNTKSEVPNPKQ